PSILVIGGAGFIGSHLCRTLLKKNCFVYCLDKLIGDKKENVKEIFDKRNFHFVKANYDKPLKNLKSLDFDYIFHLEGVDEDAWGTSDFLELAKKQRAKFLLLSSFLQSQSRESAEDLTSKYFSRFNLNARIVRPLDVYGQGMPLQITDDLTFLFTNLKDKTTFKVSGDGSKILYPLFITDAIHGLLKAMFSQGSKGKIYSLAGKETSILEFVNILKKESKRTLGIEFSSRKKEKKDPLKKRTVTETKKQLNWRPKVSFKEGVKKTL
ncbi:unnamed protein product, partial [marine sediment metagenome]